MPKTLEFDETTPHAPSIDPAEIEKFHAMATEWWSPKGKFAPLHKFNPVRLDFIRQTAVDHFGRDPGKRRPLEDLRLLDAGCGGGLVSEPMARLGASVTGIDAGAANIKAAAVHAQTNEVKIDYRVGAIEGLLAANEPQFDIVLALEVVEHVVDPARFLADCAALVRPGGLLVMGTLNRTAKAFALAIVGAEHVMRWLPPGTHEWSKFVTPAEAGAALTGAGLITKPATGVAYNPITGKWSLSNDTAVNYLLTATRPAS